MPVKDGTEAEVNEEKVADATVEVNEKDDELDNVDTDTVGEGKNGDKVPDGITEHGCKSKPDIKLLFNYQIYKKNKLPYRTFVVNIYLKKVQ